MYKLSRRQWEERRATRTGPPHQQRVRPQLAFVNGAVADTATLTNFRNVFCEGLLRRWACLTGPLVSMGFAETVGIFDRSYGVNGVC